MVHRFRNGGYSRSRGGLPRGLTWAKGVSAMPRIKYQRGFTLQRDEARRRLQGLMERFGEQYGFTCRWTDDTRVDVKGRGVSGWMTVGSDAVSLELNLSLLLSPFKSRIEDGISRKIEQALGDP